MSNNNNLAEFLFHQGTNFYAYDYMGCNLKRTDESYVYIFRVWAPNADFVGLVSDYNGWTEPLAFTKSESGVWEYELSTKKTLHGCPYKYSIRKGNKTVLKGDPYARFSRGGADGASIIYDNSVFQWKDSRWLKHRRDAVFAKDGYLASPLNIYEVHLGSFMRHEDDNSYYTYRELADILPSYVKSLGFTHIEFLPIFEHPYDGSWGYQVGAFYAPSSRFGTPDDFKHFINSCHKNGVGVILDWVPAHFPKDEWGLYEFDGMPLYEYQGRDRIESATWGTRFFDLGREEVQSFLISNAMYFFREFHVDGLRVDAVASMIYLDYDKLPTEWIPNSHGGRENLEAIAFLQKLNCAVYAEFPEALMIAEESGDYGKITLPVSEGGLGFNLKWNMGWANDFYDYLLTDPYFRKDKHSALTFPIMYAFSEKYVLPISHDEVVHGKLSFVNKMFGNYDEKFAQMRAALMLMITYPGKKLMFMGTEYAQFREWDYENSLEWFMLDYPKHTAMRQYVSSLNDFYLSHSSLWTFDFSYEGFEWLAVDEREKNLVAYKRRSRDEELMIFINFSGSTQSITLGLGEKQGPPICVFSTDFVENIQNEVKTTAEQNCFKFIIPAFSGRIYKKSLSNKITF